MSKKLHFVFFLLGFLVICILYIIPKIYDKFHSIPKVSVVVPVYKTEPYLRKCLDSVLAQTLKDIEIICVDDGSPDNSGKILDEYAKRDKRIRVIHKENGGANSAYNRGLAKAKGEYVHFLDSDDWIEPNMYTDYYAKAKETNADVVTAEGYFKDENGNSEFVRKFQKNKASKLITSLQDAPEFIKHHIVHWNSIYKNSFLKKNKIDFPLGSPDFHFGDAAFIFKVYGNAQSLYIIKGAHYHYCRYPGAGMHFPIPFGVIMFNNHLNAAEELSKSPNMTPKKWYRISRQSYDDYLAWNESNKKILSQAQRLFKFYLEDNYVNQDDFSKIDWEIFLMIANFPNFIPEKKVPLLQYKKG